MQHVHLLCPGWHKALWGGQYILDPPHCVEEATGPEQRASIVACVSFPTRVPVSMRLSARGMCAVKMNKKKSWEVTGGHCPGAFLARFAALKHDYIYLLSFMTVDLEKWAPSGRYQNGLVSPPNFLYVWECWRTSSSLTPKTFISRLCLRSGALTWKRATKCMSSGPLEKPVGLALGDTVRSLLRTIYDYF